jgi:hypothetical protein
VAGVGALFTKEFFEVAKAHLADGGAFVQWFHLYDMDDEMVRLILRTLGDVFPDVTLWHIENDIALVARTRPFDNDLDRMDARFKLTPVREYFNRLGVYDLFALLSLQLASEDGFRHILDEGPLHVDDLPLLEYRAPRAQFARSYSFYLMKHDERVLGDKSRLLYGEWVRTHPIGLNEAIDFTLLQSQQPWSPETFRLRWLDRVLEQCREPWTLARIVANFEHTKRTKEADRSLAALMAIDPASSRTLMLRAQIAIKRETTEKAAKDPAIRALLEECVSSPVKGGDVFRTTCRGYAESLGMTLAK